MEPTHAPPDHPERPPAGNPMLAIAAGAVVAVLGVGLWYGAYLLIQSYFIIPLVVGLLIGGAMRFAGRSIDPKVAFAAAAFTVASCFAGYVLIDLTLIPWQPPSDLPQAVRNFFNNIVLIILTALSAYFAYIVSRPTAMLASP